MKSKFITQNWYNIEKRGWVAVIPANQITQNYMELKGQEVEINDKTYTVKDIETQGLQPLPNRQILPFIGIVVEPEPEPEIPAITSSV